MTRFDLKVESAGAFRIDFTVGSSEPAGTPAVRGEMATASEI